MRTRFTWILGVVTLISVAALVACSSKYSNTNNGLVVVSTQGNAVMDTFSLDLGNGHITWIFNSEGPPTAGQPTAVVLDPAGDYAYVIVTQSTNVNASVTGIEAFSVASDGKLGPIKTTGLNDVGAVPAAPVAMVIDSAGKFLFVADAATGTLPGAISVLSVGSGGTLSEVAGSPFVLPAEPGGTTPNPSALAITPTVYPVAYSFCSGSVPPTTENLYVTDSLNYKLINYSVSSSGALQVVPTASAAPSVPTGTTPSGVTVDPCNRFAYVSNQRDNSVSAYTICNVVSLPKCAKADFSLLPVIGSPFITGIAPGPLLEDALANFLYVLNTGQNEISAYRISTTTGSLAPLSPATIATNSYPTSMAIRSDDSWLFVTNLNQANLSQYAITPSSGGLTPETPVETDNFPWGIAVK
ncbi:MAG: beta-propeller fold lactonase family protein [Candidatus Sulfotelmatobacter sp.]|jgi:6-phosphogluconolactonase (cycloisomerase 2 family)